MVDCLDALFFDGDQLHQPPDLFCFGADDLVAISSIHTDLSKIFGAFQVSYAITWLLGGIFLDAVGTRLGLALAVIFWSVVNILTGFANSVFGFAGLSISTRHWRGLELARRQQDSG